MAHRNEKYHVYINNNYALAIVGTERHLHVTILIWLVSRNLYFFTSN